MELKYYWLIHGELATEKNKNDSEIRRGLIRMQRKTLVKAHHTPTLEEVDLFFNMSGLKDKYSHGVYDIQQMTEDEVKEWDEENLDRIPYLKKPREMTELIELDSQKEEIELLLQKKLEECIDAFDKLAIRLNKLIETHLVPVRPIIENYCKRHYYDDNTISIGKLSVICHDNSFTIALYPGISKQTAYKQGDFKPCSLYILNENTTFKKLRKAYFEYTCYLELEQTFNERLHQFYALLYEELEGEYKIKMEMINKTNL